MNLLSLVIVILLWYHCDVHTNIVIFCSILRVPIGPYLLPLHADFRPWCSGCSRSRRKPLKVSGWKAPSTCANFENLCDISVLGWSNKLNPKESQRSSLNHRSLLIWWSCPFILRSRTCLTVKLANIGLCAEPSKHQLWQATRTTPPWRTFRILTISRILKPYPQTKDQKEVYDWIDRLSIFSCTRMFLVSGLSIMDIQVHFDLSPFWDVCKVHAYIMHST